MIVKRKTRKVIRKSVNKALKKHGPKITAGLAGGIASTLATLASTEAAGSKRKKSNLAALSKKIADTVTGEESRKKKRSGKVDGGKREKKRLSEREQMDESA